MHNKNKTVISAIIIDIIIALLFVIIILSAIYLGFKEQISWAISGINLITLEENVNKQDDTIKLDGKKFKNIPEYGTQYANIKIEKIDVDLPLYYGDDLDTLKKGVGHSTGSYFPGQGGSILCMGHNSKNVFRRFNELEIGDKILITTTYGKFEYEIYDYKIIQETDKDKVPIQDEKEVLMVYTCYPLNNIGYAYQRYVVYANLVEE